MQTSQQPFSHNLHKRPHVELNIWLRLFQRPPPTSDMSDTNMIYDDHNSNFMYQPDVWFAGTWNASNVGQSGTLHTSNDPTANVTFVRTHSPKLAPFPCS